jgi:hypothetical protein
MAAGSRMGTAGAVMLLAVSACSSGGSATTPGGYVRAVGVRVSVAHPRDWQSQPSVSPPMIAAAQSPDKNAQVDILEDLTSSGSEGLQVEVVEAGPEMGFAGYHRTKTKSMSVKGAKAATRVDYAFNDERQGPCEAVDVAILAKNDHIHAVRIIWHRGRLTPKVVDRIVGSIEVR